MGTLREEFLCATYNRLINIRVKWLSAAQRTCLAREDEISRAGINDKQRKEYGLPAFISSSRTDSDDFCHAMKENVSHHQTSWERQLSSER
jgi:hypothetical protein